MATVSDTLETIFVLKGAENMARAFERIGKKTMEMAEAQGAALTRTQQLSLAMQELTGGPVTAAIAGLTILGALLGKAAATFAEDEQAIFRTTVVLRNMGSSLPIEELQRFADELHKTVAVDDEAVVAMGGLLARFGVAGSEIPKTLKAIVDASQGTGKSIEEVTQAVGRGALGQTRGLKDLIGNFKATGDAAKDLIAIREKLDAKFAGSGEARANTLAGAFERLGEHFADLLSAIGSRLAPLLINVANTLVAAIDFLTANLDRLAKIAAILSGSPLGIAIAFDPTRNANAAAKIGGANGPQPATEETAEEIAANTKQMTTALGRFLVGGGAAASAALNIRGLNAALRAGR